MRTLIVGAGPAGLLAAHGAWTAGSEVTIFDAKPVHHPATIFSLQYLHKPCGLELLIRSFRLSYKVHGVQSDVLHAFESNRTTARDLYNRKLGRPAGEENSTRFLFEPSVRVWSLKDAYRVLWNIYKGTIKHQPVEWPNLISMARIYDLVINTAPLPKLRPDLTWPTRDSLIAMDWTPMEIEENTCVYSLDPDVPWYRATRIDGGTATEYCRMPDILSHRGPELQPLRKVAPHQNTYEVTNALPSNVILTGRWGSWDPAKLTHHAYEDARRGVLNAQRSVRASS